MRFANDCIDSCNLAALAERLDQAGLIAELKDLEKSWAILRLNVAYSTNTLKRRLELKADLEKVRDL